MSIRTVTASGSLALSTFFLLSLLGVQCRERGESALIPLPEHPRPDFMRSEWVNLNGQWDFSLDSLEVGEKQGWPKGEIPFPRKITVPFSWAAPLSGIGVKDIHVAWYARNISVPREWKRKRVFLVIGACDFAATAWLNGKLLGTHEGGYIPFEFDLSDSLARRGGNRLVLRVEDKPVRGRMVGKQVYGEAKGIWQTVYLEARSPVHITTVRFIPNIVTGHVRAEALLSGKPRNDLTLEAAFPNGEVAAVRTDIPMGNGGATLDIPLPKARLWSLEDPYLYEAELSLIKDGEKIDRVLTYFGMRSIGTACLPGSTDRYVTLNGSPVYLKMTLDQSYHSEGYYTFPSDALMKGEIERAKALRLNTLRIHIKTELPRKLYWADKLGLLLMCDIPNIGGEPDTYGRRNWETAAWRQIERDFNHPSIFSWILFNESWGLATGRDYLPETREWVKSLYYRAKEADPTRLVEDNSPDQSRLWHVASDINSWHAYLPGYRWAEFMDNVVKNTCAGSAWNYITPYRQNDIPMMNSECGNVWGYRGGTGDVDIAYEYHLMINEFRKRPKISGFLFTEFHDVINEWNGYYRFDRSLKDFGLAELCPGMEVNHFHSDVYPIPGDDFKMTVAPGDSFFVPLRISVLTDRAPSSLTVQTLLHGWNRLGDHKEYSIGRMSVPARPWALTAAPPMMLTAPDEECLAMLCTYVMSGKGDTLGVNFVPIRVLAGDAPRREAVSGAGEVVRLAPNKFSKAEWSVKQSAVFDSLKAWGTGKGYFEYAFPWPDGLEPSQTRGVEFIAELAARTVQGKDMADSHVSMGIEQVSAKGVDPGHNPNSYPMTDTTRHPSKATITLNGLEPQVVELEDDPADHRGVLSWLAQKEDGNLREAGSYGYLVRVKFSPEAAAKAAKEGALVVRLAVNEAGEHSGGLCVYGEKFGRYPVEPTVLIQSVQNPKSKVHN
ncbi:MAG: glycoside hydrolase family 2 protein [Candidatus Latescibacterota bacterium]